MVRIFGIAALLCTVSGSLAMAAEVPSTTVQIAGNQPQEAHVALLKAAERVCLEARNNDVIGEFGGQTECMKNTMDQAMVEMKSSSNDEVLAANMRANNSVW